MIPYSLLDLSPICEGATAADSFRATLDLARAAEREGFTRYWLAEHHNMPGIASAATSILISHVAAGTSTIRVGSGGIMLPNHSPLVIAEQFGTLATLHGDRIDLGLGRAPGTDMPTARALRRGMDGVDRFPQDVMELMDYLGDPDPGRHVNAIPGVGTKVPVWILGSSLYGAQLAAHLGLPYAFASHFAPQLVFEAAQVYRDNFRDTGRMPAPHFMLAANVFAADTEAEARRIRTSSQIAMARLRTGTPGPLPRPVARIEDVLSPAQLAMVSEIQAVSAVGDPDQVRDQLAALIRRHRPDEVILAGHIHDPAARIRSFEIAAEAMRTMAPATAA
ncbi:LLM class flavin-dependent oxidoreductase [Albimonas sp. CAU 1670]|uniref:LLM class flavin-dependent oxidoreductase n=1 Tax=Albimonas sp. CAU 1670 TaxID=3032599 RepID=UPI0023DA7E81|nr:LLM class flavin-dependent oxidoreductase [Albimonas sp. CAU 1670]MDF2234650.1 LLM class flavin-dependent oxidoreductase [Albimonas sp. CAU 1670]